MSLLAQTSTQQLVTSSITARTAQFQTLSTLTFNVSSINGIVPGGAFNGSTMGISSATVNTSSLQTLNLRSVQGYISSLVVDSLAIGSNNGFIDMGDVITTSLSSIQINTNFFSASGPVCTPQIIVSTINGQSFAQPFQSTFLGLGTAGYISSTQLFSTVAGIGSGFTGSTVGLSAATINVSSIRSISLSSVQGYVSSFRTDSLTVGGPSGYVNIQDLITQTTSTGQFVAGSGFISSLQINSLSFGPSGYVIVGDVIANSLSTQRLNTQALYTNNAYIGNVSSQSAILFPGIDGTFKGTAIAERTTGIGTQELLLYKASTTTDQIRLQTTGNIVFEVGALARSWNSTTQLATPSLYIAGSTSNVGVGTATPAATLDVAGTGRFQILSTLAFNVSTINGAVPGGSAFTGSTTNLFIPYSSNNSVSTFTLQTNTASSMISFGTNTGKTQSQVYIGDLFNQLNLSTNISPVVLIDSVFPTNSITVSTFRSSGIFIVPSNVSFINVHLWGSGGSNSGSVGGGGGAFLTGFLPVTPGQRLHVTVNQAGGRGAGGYVNVHGGGFAGIYDSISTATNVLAVAAGGGGGGGYSDRGGGGGGVFVGKTFGYTAGTQTTPGNFGTAYKLKGGDGADNGYGAGPGGGGGWWGGSGASGDSVGILSGAGGSSYFSNLINWSGEDGANGHVGGLAGGKWSPYYANNYGDSNTIGAAVIAWAPTLRQTNLLELRDVTQGRMFAVNRNLNMGIGVSSVGNNYTVEVNGNAYISSLVTLNTLTSNMTIPLSNINPLTLTSTQSIFAMNTISSGAQLAFGTTQAYGLFGKYSQVYMGDVKQIQGNFTNSDPVLRIDQDFPLAPSSNVSIISFSTTVNTYTVPAGMTMAKAYLWGQGGKGWGGTTSNGGGGAFISGTFSVIPGEQLAVAVNYGAGGGFGANGGGLTGIFRSTIAQSNTIAIAAGGGGGGSFVTTVGGFGGVVAGSSGSYRGPNVGLGATQTAAGAGAGEGASSGGALQGGGGGAGGGAGYFGGGGGGNNSVDQVGGGGGSSFVGGLFPGSIVAENGNLGTPPGIGPPPGLGLGGGKFAPFYFGTNGDGGGSGWGVIVFARAFRQTNLLELRGPTSRNLVAVDSQMNMGINVSSVTSSITLDVGGIGRFITLSSFSLNVSSINGVVPGGTFNGSTLGISTSIVRTSTLNTVFLSSVQGYVSSFRTDSLTVGGTSGFVNIQDLITQTTSTGQFVAGSGFISSLQINSLSFGPSGYVIVGDVIANSLSTTRLNTQSFYTNNAYIGNVSSQSAILFPGIDRNYRGTAVAEQTTGVGTQELLLYKVSSTTDQIRLQTTGNIVFEAGAAARSWPSTTQLATPTLYIAGSSSNVGVGTASPATTLDVVGTGRFQTLSTLSFNVSSINGAAPGGTFNGSTTSLSSAVINVSSLSSAYITSAQGYISSLTVDYLAIGSNLGFINMGDIITTSHSSLQINTGTLTASGPVQAQSVSTLQTVTSSIGIGTATPSYQLDVAGTARAQRVIAQPSGTTPATSVSPLAVINGNAYLSFSPQIEFQYNSGGYKHFMGSRHNGNFVGNFGNAIDFWLYSAASGGSTASTAPNAGNVNTLSVTAGGVGIFNNSPAYALDVIGIINTQTSVQAPVLSTLALNVSSINGTVQWQQSFLTSTVGGLATSGYISTTQLTSTTANLITRIGAGGGGGGTTFVGSTTFLSASQVLISSQTNYNLSSVLGFISSLQVDELQIGNGYGILGFGDTQMSSVSSIAVVANLGQFMTMSTLAINASSITGVVVGATFTGTLGTVSSLTALRYYGLTGSYANTAIAEVSTGTGTQELLLYKVSSIADQVRVQTTGNVIFEAGVGARSWPTASRATVPTFYIAGSNSNVGVGTSNPVTTLDVAGTGRFQTLSSLNITAGSINYSVAFV